MTLLVLHLAAVLLAAIALWAMRHEITEKAGNDLDWVLGPALAVVVAAILLIVSPGKRFELWLAGIAVGLLLGAAMALTRKINQDFGRRVIRVQRTWDGAAAAALLLVLTLARVVTSHLIVRESGRFGVLGAAAAFLASYLAARYLVIRFYKAPRSIHLDMPRGQNPRRTLVH
ncbi:MAG: hypothetical protein FJX11_25305 [Alphaproteobacteria bacterium]|nr:hypothetical protein [Alphaproteobacteria bacterium]